MKARVFARRVRVPHPTHRYRSHVTRLHWFAIIRDTHGTIVWEDDCSILAHLLDETRTVAAAFDCVASLGHQLDSWDEIVERAEDL